MLFLHLLLLPLAASRTVEWSEYSILAEWSQLDFDWDEQHNKTEYLESQLFIPSNNALAGINVDSNQNVYLTVPRWKSGVPGTLNKLVKNSVGDYVLSPWPSWDMQEVGASESLQNCQSMKIDGEGRMWVIEVGRRNFYDDPAVPVVNGPAGVWLIDVASGDILSKYYFPAEVVSYSESFVNDIVLDETREIAYLTDAWGDGALLVYDFQQQKSRRYTGTSTMAEPDYVMIINGVYYGSNLFTTPVDGIAITDDQEALFYCNVQGTKLHRLPTSVLRDFSTTDEEITDSVEVMGTKQPSDGIIYLNGNLIYGSLTESTYYSLPVSATSDTFTNLEDSTVPVWPELVNFRWVDTFSNDLSDASKFWFVSNSLDLYFAGTMKFSSGGNTNFRVISAKPTDTASTSSDEDDDDDNAATYRSALIAVSVLFGVVTVIAGIVIYGKMSLSKANDINSPLIS